MASIIENEKELKVLKLDRKEFLSLGGSSICDACNKAMLGGYYIAVLNSAYCEEDYLKWLNRTVSYKGDASFEEKKFNQMKAFLNVQ